MVIEGFEEMIDPGHVEKQLEWGLCRVRTAQHLWFGAAPCCDVCVSHVRLICVQTGASYLPLAMTEFVEVVWWSLLASKTS